MLFFPRKILTTGVNLIQILGVFGAGLILMLSGTWDDYYNLKPKWQFWWVIVSVLIIIFSGTTIKFITRPGGGVLNLAGPKFVLGGQDIYLLGGVFTFLWLIIITNTTKLLDGVDGLASGITLIGTLILFIISLFWDQPNSGTSMMIIVFTGSILGFLVLNFYPAKIFLGNGGSNLLGLFLGTLAIVSGAKIATALLVMTLPLLDMLWVIIQRIKKNESPFKHADRKHFHFRLLDLGFSQKQTVLIIYLISFIFGTLALFQGTIGKLFTLLFLVIFTLIIFRLVYKSDNKIHEIGK